MFLLLYSGQDIDAKFSTINGNSFFFDIPPPGPTIDKSVTYLSRADSDTPAKPPAVGLNE